MGDYIVDHAMLHKVLFQCWHGKYCCKRICLKVGCDPNYWYDLGHKLLTCLLTSKGFLLFAYSSRGWKDVFIRYSVPMTVWNMCQDFEMNLLSLSDIMISGIPCNLTISLMYRLDSYYEVWVVLRAKKWVVLVRPSITTQIASCCLIVLDRPIMKSIVICSHFHTSIGRGCNKPPGFCCSD